MNKHKTVGPIHYGGNDTVRTIQVYVMTAASAGAYPGGGEVESNPITLLLTRRFRLPDPPDH